MLCSRDHKSNASSEVFIGPFTYRKFMQCLHTLYKRASERLRRETGRLQQAFDTLEETRKDARTMQKAIGVSSRLGCENLAFQVHLVTLDPKYNVNLESQNVDVVCWGCVTAVITL